MQPGRFTGSGIIIRRLSDDPAPERYIPEALPWILEAGNPCFNWIFGGHEATWKNLSTWIRRSSSEVSITRVTLLVTDDGPVRGFIGLDGAELSLCRKADWLAILKEARGNGRTDLITLFAGHGYVQLSRTLPPARTQAMLARSDSHAVIADAESADEGSRTARLPCSKRLQTDKIQK